MVEGIHKVGEEEISVTTETKGNGNDGRGIVHPGRQVARQDNRAQFYTFPGKNEAKTSYIVITCTILICDRMNNVLVDPGYIYFYVSTRFVVAVARICYILYVPIHVSILVGNFVIVNHAYRGCPILLWVFILGLIW